MIQTCSMETFKIQEMDNDVPTKHPASLTVINAEMFRTGFYGLGYLSHLASRFTLRKDIERLFSCQTLTIEEPLMRRWLKEASSPAIEILTRQRRLRGESTRKGTLRLLKHLRTYATKCAIQSFSRLGGGFFRAGVCLSKTKRLPEFQYPIARRRVEAIPQ